MYGMLTGKEILRQAELGNINIGEINPSYAGPNSYDIEIGDTITTYRNIAGVTPLDMADKDSMETYTYDIPEEGVVIYPGQLYLVSSRYQVGSNMFIPIITGRSSVGRMGISVHQEAGFGDLGFYGKWTLQLSTIYPVRIYPFIRMAQIYFLTACGERDKLYSGKYQNSLGEAGSKIYLDMK